MGSRFDRFGEISEEEVFMLSEASQVSESIEVSLSRVSRPRIIIKYRDSNVS